MIELRLHTEIYGEPGIDTAVDRYRAYATLERLEEPGYRVVRVTASSPSRERRVAGELANCALGLTVAAKRGSPASPPSGG